MALLLIGAPFNVQFAGLGTADMALTTFRLGSLVYLVKCIKQLTRPSPEPSPGVPGEGIEGFVLCGLFTFFAAITKSEGMPLAILNFLLIVFFAAKRHEWKALAAFSIPLAIGLLIWLLFSSRLPHTDEAYFSRLTLANLQAGLPHLREILQSLLKAFVDYQNWGLLWLLPPVLALLRFTSFKSPVITILWLSLLAHLSIYILIYLITPWNLSDLLPVTVPRLLLHIAPTAMLLVAGHAGTILRVASPPPNRI